LKVAFFRYYHPYCKLPVMDWLTTRQEKTRKWSDFQSAVLEILDSAVTAVQAVKGNVQLFNPKNRALQIIAQRRFDHTFLQLFENVRADEPSACGRAFRNRCRVMISDIAKDPLFSPYLSVARANGFCAVQSTPILAPDRSAMGILSTHFAEVHHLSIQDEIALDNHAAKLSRLINDLLDVAIVQLRSHPGLFLGAKPSWPPIWANTNRDMRGTTWGEMGVLLKAYTTDQLSKTCYLVMEHESETYIGALILKNAAFCQHLCSVFQRNVGRTISEIGSLNLAYTL
jgi:hypothetical protein